MGILRVFLALSVVAWHANAPFAQYMMWADVAVKLFFIISGFYMSLILSGKYRIRGSSLFFYSNRALRLYPSYFIAFLLTFALGFAAEKLPNAPEKSALVMELIHRFDNGSTQLSGTQLAWVLIPNLTLFGSDIIYMFHRTIAATWAFMIFDPPGAHADTDRAGMYLLVSPVWSIGMEIWFYLLAPLIVRFRTVLIMLLALASMALRFWMDWRQPWSTYFFFPAALGFFLIGILAQRVWAAPQFRRIATASVARKVAIAGLFLLILRYAVPGYRNHAELIYGVLTCTIPFLFESFKDIPWDRWMGNLSYPIYLLHPAAMAAVHNYLGSLLIVPIMILTLALAVILNIGVDEPLERYRQRRLARRRAHQPVDGEIARP